MYGYVPPADPFEPPPRATLGELKQMYADLAAVLCRIEKAGERLELFHDLNQMRVTGQSGTVKRSPNTPGYWESQ